MEKETEGACVVLVAETNSERRGFYITTLEDAGYQVICQPTMPAAFAAAAQHEGTVMVMVQLPQPAGLMFDIFRKFRSDPATSHVPVIVLTQIEDSFTREQIVRAG